MNRDERVTAIVELIRDPATGRSLSGSAWESIVHVLRECGLLGTVAALAERSGDLPEYDGYARRHLQSMLVYSRRQAQQVRFECTHIAACLMAEGIEPVFLKGAGYTLRDSRNAQGRVYTDIDVLVPRPKIESARCALARDAWYSPPITDYDERYYRKWAHEIPPLKHLMRRTVIDLHHNIVPPISGRAPDMARLLGHVEYTAEGFAVLSPAAAALHSMVHLFTNEDFANGFRDLVDLHLLVDEFGGAHFWQELLDVAGDTGFSRELAYGVALLGMVLGHEVPDSCRKQLVQQVGHVNETLLVRQWFRRALRPHHPDTCGWFDELAIRLVYLRGHWIKMPLPVLVGHLIVKGSINARDKLLGKYRDSGALTVPGGGKVMPGEK